MTDPVQLEAEILDNRGVARDHFLMTLAAPSIAATARPGQFVMLRPGSTADPLLPRAFSLYGADPRQGRIQLLYRVIGAGTRRMCALHPGTAVPLWGPLGTAFTPAPSGRHLLVGGGVGVPPIVFLAAGLRVAPGEERLTTESRSHGEDHGGSGQISSGRRAAAAPPRAEAFVGAATAEYLVGVEDLRATGVPVALATDDGTAGRRGFVTELLREALEARGEEATVYACGPMPMLAAVARLCAAAGATCQLALEAPMACGVGACLGCTVPRAAGGYARVCTEGPVFDAREIAWESLRGE